MVLILIISILLIFLQKIHPFLVIKAPENALKLKSFLNDANQVPPQLEINLDRYSNFTLIEKVLFNRFANSVALELGSNTQAASDFKSLISQINVMAKLPEADVHFKGKSMLVNLFPSWLLPQFRWMFAKPFPTFSLWMNSWVTKKTTNWLMGPSEITDLIMEDGTIYKDQLLKIEKCAFLEESQCVRTCLHACKVSTQDFFMKEMGLPVTLSPNFDDLSCEFKFGMKPLDLQDDEISQSPCFDTCNSIKKSQNKSCQQFKEKDLK